MDGHTAVYRHINTLNLSCEGRDQGSGIPLFLSLCFKCQGAPSFSKNSNCILLMKVLALI